MPDVKFPVPNISGCGMFVIVKEPVLTCILFVSISLCSGV